MTTTRPYRCATSTGQAAFITCGSQATVTFNRGFARRPQYRVVATCAICYYLWSLLPVVATTCGCYYLWLLLPVVATTCGCYYLWLLLPVVAPHRKDPSEVDVEGSLPGAD